MSDDDVCICISIYIEYERFGEILERFWRQCVCVYSVNGTEMNFENVREARETKQRIYIYIWCLYHDVRVFGCCVCGYVSERAIVDK